jgi:Iodothyronine deiodinase
VRSNERDKVIFVSARSLDERAGVAGLCRRDLKIDLPVLVDDIDDRVDRDYMAWPDRLYVIDREGKVAFKSPPGPFGFKASAVREALQRLLG